MGFPQWVLLAVVAQRLIELLYSQSNTQRLRAAGAVETGSRHYPLFILLHGGWLVTLFVATPADAPVSWPLLGLYGLLQLARLWVVGTLGRYWTTRIISLPGAPLVKAGPYRWIRHPNYLIVALELPLLPLVFGEWLLALFFGGANLLLLRHRIGVEDAALSARASNRLI